MTAARLKSQNGDLLVRDGSVDTSIKSGIAKYFIHFGMNDFVIDQSFNSSSVTDAGVGHADLYFTNNMSAARYSFTGFSNCNGTLITFNGQDCWGMGIDYDTGTLKSPTNGLGLHTWAGGSIDAAVNTAQTFGDLA